MVPDFAPFPGLRYGLDALGVSLAQLTAPPYDVIDAEAQARFEAAHPANAIHLILPRDDGSGDRYQRAARFFTQWRDEGVLTPDDPRFYVYRMTFTDDSGVVRTTLGVVGALELSPPGAGAVLPHERTMPKPRDDRLNLIREVRANLDPVWCLSLAPGLSDLLTPVGTPAASCSDGDGVAHCLFPVEDQATAAAIAATVGSAPAVIADGHHRYETALAYRDERRAAQPPGGDAGPAERIMALVVELAEDQLCVAAIHRLVHGTRGGLRQLTAALARTEAAGPNHPEGVSALLRRMHDEDALGLVDADGLWLLTPDLGAIAPGLDRLPEPLRAVDAARLDVLLSRLGPAGPTSVEYPHDPLAAAAAVAKGTAEAAVFLRPPSVAQIAAVAAAGERMPEKTTFFRPKPLTGLVFRSLDGERR